MYENELMPMRNTATNLAINAQAVLDFTLIGTRLKMAFSKIGSVNTFVILPISKEPGAGMSIDDMIKEIGNLIHGYDSSLAFDLKNEDISGAIKDVNEAANTNPQKTDSDIDYKSIRIALRQAFLMLSTGNPVEFALEIDVDLSGLFPSGQSFVNVDKLSLAVWNTQREKIIDMMNIVEVSKLLEDPA